MVEKNSEKGEGSARWVLACELRRLRESSGRSLAQLADEANYDRTYLHRLETGERLSKLPVMKVLDRTYGTGELLVNLWGLARLDAFKDKYRLFMQLEANATIIHKYTLVVPGLLQTEDFARFVLSSGPAPITPEELEESVAARLGRQELLRRDPPPDVRIILDESVLRRPVPDPKLWHEQLVRIAEAGNAPTMTIQVMPFAAGVHALTGGPLSLLWMADGSAVAYLEGNKSGELIEEPGEIERYRLAYDRLRDAALSPRDSSAFIQQLVEDSRP
ncbi:helix-turn-helix protein [Streptomyces sp. 2333.5]|uniref:helix-turn-helix domain-containing protein n=1 Tax=unclassified Streptomyces TaxID=2593676 RepID=UPI00089C0C35|nr:MULTISPECIES: helix-turn-helix transcriptional regulator [unclassified Streptomyces]PJJ03062.1 helix-turn-helix protein [Streptomyces sp. 2333.5]SED60275.1 Helix-turn-helix domain-containing protein [Streptomyces sp. 2314.4]SEE28637.1 Helix-turn-helix domain-containing protein [Streptomyces sp. 2112.2]